ncbi:hypothetical protein [uncultured Roseobacter sp.]|nr:hypothetical protein [uncultured Roseobacter sp.]
MTQPRLLWINPQGADWALVQPLVDAGALPRLAASASSLPDSRCGFRPP